MRFKLKFYFLILSIFFADIAFGKDKIIIALNFQGVVGVTSHIVNKGALLAYHNSSFDLKKRYDIVTVDIGETLESVKTSLLQEIKRGHPIAIMGAVSSNQAFMINAVSSELKIPFITPLATHPDVTKTNKFAFRTCFDDHFQTAKLADFIHKDHKGNRGLVLYNEKQSYAVGVKNTFIDSYSKFKGSFVHSLKFTTVDEVKNAISEIEKIKPTFIVLPSYQVEAANILSVLADKFKDIKFYGTDSWGGGRLFHTILSELPFQVEGFYVQHWSPDYPSEKNKLFLKLTKQDQFLSKYESAAMLAPAAVGYDALNFILLANEKTKNKKISLEESLKNLNFEGATGNINLRGDQTPSKALFIYKISNKGESFYVSYP
jgi:branched-chain amino acid transport system substrate-binding protein